MAKPLLAFSVFSAPQEIAKQDMNLILELSNNKEEVLNSYTLSKDGKTYKLNDISNAEKGKLNINLTNGLLIKQMVGNEEIANQIKNSMMANMPEKQKLAMKNMSLAQIITMMPKEEKISFIGKIETELPSKIDEMITELPESMLEQAAIQEVKTQYQFLGANTDDIQNEYILIAGLQMLGIAAITMISAVTIMLLSA